MSKRRKYQSGGELFNEALSQSQMMPYWARQAAAQSEYAGERLNQPQPIGGGLPQVPNLAAANAPLPQGLIGGPSVLAAGMGGAGPWGTPLPNDPRHNTAPFVSVYHPLPEPPAPYRYAPPPVPAPPPDNEDDGLERELNALAERDAQEALKLPGGPAQAPATHEAIEGLVPPQPSQQQQPVYHIAPAGRIATTPAKGATSAATPSKPSASSLRSNSPWPPQNLADLLNHLTVRRNPQQ